MSRRGSALSSALALALGVVGLWGASRLQRLVGGYSHPWRSAVSTAILGAALLLLVASVLHHHLLAHERECEAFFLSLVHTTYDDGSLPRGMSAVRFRWSYSRLAPASREVFATLLTDAYAAHSVDVGELLDIARELAR